MSYTEGPIDREWEVERADTCCWVQRIGWNERNAFTKGQEIIFPVDTEEQAEALVTRLNELDRLRRQETALLLRFADAFHRMTDTVREGVTQFEQLESEIRDEAQRLTEERQQ